MSSWSTLGLTARICRICDWSDALFRLAPIADGGSDFAREGHGAVTKIVLHPSLGQPGVEDRETERYGHDDGQA